jgi:hypothetical protein
MIANGAHSSHGIVLLLVRKVRKACPFSICHDYSMKEVDYAGGIVSIDNDDKGQLV